MLSLSPRFDTFRFLFPKEFIPSEVYDKWQIVLNKEPAVITTPIDYLNESIKGITFPSIENLVIQQPQTSTHLPNTKNRISHINTEPSQENNTYSTTNPLSNISRNFAVTMRLNQGFYNYFMCYETIFYRICKQYLYSDGDNFQIEIMDETGRVSMIIKLFQCKIEGIDGLELSYDKVERQADTFNLNFVFNNIDLDFV